VFCPSRRDLALRAQWGVASNGLAVIYVGRMAAEKNLQLAVRSFRALQRLVPDARYVWVGDGPARAALAAQNPDFIFCGVQRGEELARHYASADLFIFPSLTETFGNVTLEALASGVPTVAFDYGAAREHLTGACGRLVPFGDGDAFVDAACDFVANPDRNARAAARAAVASLDPRAVTASFVDALAALDNRIVKADGASTALTSREAVPCRSGTANDAQLMRSPS
jgi:glycosyltransferase involved in cell wall biosynthesis